MMTMEIVLQIEQHDQIKINEDRLKDIRFLGEAVWLTTSQRPVG